MDANNSGTPQSSQVNTNPTQDSPSTNQPNTSSIPNISTPPTPPIETPSAVPTETNYPGPISVVPEPITPVIPPQPPPIEPIVEPVISPVSSTTPTPTIPPEPSPSPLPVTDTPIDIETPSPSPVASSDQTPKKGKKFATIGLVVLGILGFAAANYFALRFLNNQALKNKASSSSNTKLTTQSNKKVEAITTHSGEKSTITAWVTPKNYLSETSELPLEIIKETLSWLNEQRDSRGAYIFGYRCPTEGNCSIQESDNRAGLAAIWTRFKYYELQKNPQDLEILTKDINLYSNESELGVIQNDFWNCVLMSEMWKSNLIPNQSKEKVKSICDNSSYYSPILSAINQLSPEELNKEPNVNQLINGINTLPPTLISIKDLTLVQLAAFSTDFTAKSLWNKNDLDLKIAKRLFEKSASLWQQQKNENYTEGSCVLGISSLDLNQATQNSDYLNYANYLVEQSNLSQLLNSSSQNKNNQSLFDLATCGLFVKRLYKATSNADYLALSKNFYNILINNYFLKPTYTNGVEGFGSFASYYNQSNQQKTIQKSTRDNGLTIGFLLTPDQ